MEVIPVVYTLKCVILAKYNSCDQTLSCVLRGEPTGPIGCCRTAHMSRLLPGARELQAPLWSPLPQEFLRPSQIQAQ